MADNGSLERDMMNGVRRYRIEHKKRCRNCREEYDCHVLIDIMRARIKSIHVTLNPDQAELEQHLLEIRQQQSRNTEIFQKLSTALELIDKRFDSDKKEMAKLNEEVEQLKTRLDKLTDRIF